MRASLRSRIATQHRHTKTNDQKKVGVDQEPDAAKTQAEDRSGDPDYKPTAADQREAAADAAADVGGAGVGVCERERAAAFLARHTAP